jgi:hypothetical protein
MRVLIRFSDVRFAGGALLKEQAIGGTGKRTVGVKRGVQGPRDFVRRCCFWASLAALSACAPLTDTLEVTPFLREQVTGDTWRACAAREYQAQARAQARSGRNWKQASLLAAKGRSALNGERPELESVPNALRQQRARLDNLQTSQKATCACATAQARLDGWSVALEQDPGRDQTTYLTAFNAAASACDQQR